MFTKHDKKRVAEACKDTMISAFHDVLYPNVSCCCIPLPTRYPCEAFEVQMRVCAEFPIGVSDLVGDEQLTMLQLRPHVQRWDARAKLSLAALGGEDYCHGGWGDFNPSVTLPPLDPCNLSEYLHALKYYRPMTHMEQSAYRSEQGHEPFTDEYWICVRYSGVNIFRAVTVKYDAFSRFTPLVVQESRLENGDLPF